MTSLIVKPFKKVVSFVTLLVSFLLMTTVSLFGQTRTISGTVFDNTGNPLAAATVQADGSNPQNVISDRNGNFSIQVSQDATSLTISSLGALSQVVAIAAGSGSVGSIVLNPDSEDLEEVVLVGYGYKKRADITASISVISSEEIDRFQTSNIQQAFSSIAPGVQSTVGSGQPGAATTIQIRGISSLNGSLSPLYVVNGSPFLGSLNALPSYDLSQTTILKDAGAGSIYGSRAGNGVILLETKKGYKGGKKKKFSVNARVGFTTRSIPEYDLLNNPDDYYVSVWKALKHGEMFKSSNPLSEADAAQYASNNLIDRLKYNIYPDIANELVVTTDGVINPARGNRLDYKRFDEVFYNPAVLTQDYNLSYQGGGKKSAIYFSLGYLDVKGFIAKTQFTRYAATLRYDYEPVKNLNFTLAVNGAYTTTPTTQSGSSTYQSAFVFSRTIAPIYPAYAYERDPQSGTLQVKRDENGKLVPDFGNNSDLGVRPISSNENPIATLDLDIRKSSSLNTYGFISLDYTILKHFTFFVTGVANFVNSSFISFQNPTFGNAASVNGRGTVSYNQNRSSVLNQRFQYRQTFSNKHNVDVLLGHESYQLVNNNLNGNKENFLLPDNPQLASASTIQSLNSQEDEFTLESYFLRASYNFSSKYYIDATVRRDASSRFAPDKRWGNFWAVSGAWRIIKENFMKNLLSVDDLKLRLSYGSLGNEDVGGIYAYQDLFSISNNNGQLSVALDSKGNPDLTWETVSTFNIGLDVVLFNRLGITLDYFDKRTSNLFFNRPQAPSTGVTSYPANIGAMRNNGLEIEIKADVVRTKNFTWKTTFLASFFKNTIETLPPELLEANDGIFRGNLKLVEQGSAVDFYLYDYLGVDEQTGKAKYKKYVDSDGEKLTFDSTTTEYDDLTVADRVFQGSAVPDLYGRWTNNLKWKNFDFSFVLNYSIGGLTYDSPYQSLMGGGSDIGESFHKDILKSWTPSNTSATVPKLDAGDQNVNGTSSRWLVDASYLNITQITFGYKLNKSVVDKLGIKSLRFYVSMDNVALFSARKGLDPRQSLAGFITNVYTPLSTYALGLQLRF